MHPILFQIGPLKIYSYGLCLALAFILAAYLAKQEAGRRNIDPEKIINFSLGALIFGVLGARLLYILQNLKYYLGYPLEMLMFQRGGLSFYGGLFAAMLFAAIFFKRQRWHLWETFDLVCPYLALAQAIGRIGCFFNGCCYGKPTDSLFCVHFPGEDLARQPVQLYSTLGLLLIFIILRILPVQKSRTNYFAGRIFLLYCLLYSAFRFFIEFLRGDNLPLFAGLTIHQLISMGIFISAGIIWWNNAKLSIMGFPRR